MRDAVSRRSTLALILGAVAASACTAKTPEKVEPPPEPTVVKELASLATSAGLAWLVRAKPRAIAQISFLIPSIAKIIPEERFDAFKAQSGMDPRQLHEVLFLKYGDALRNAEAQIVRHNGDGAALEKKFLARITSDAMHTRDKPDLVRLFGSIGNHRQGFARIGKDVVMYQQEGDEARGPIAIASLFARGKLTKAPRLLAGEPLASLVARFGEAPVVAAAIGPFPEEWNKAARGLFAVATAVGASARPTARENVGLALALVGNYGRDAAKAAEILKEAWGDLATTSMGHLLGLDHPIEDPITAGNGDVVTLSVELAPARLAEGLRALAAEDLDAIMKLD